MGRILISVLFLIACVAYSLHLHNSKKNLKVATREFERIFTDVEHSCVTIGNDILITYKDILPDSIGTDSTRRVFLSALFDAICFIDDYGIDQRTIAETNGVKTLSFFSAKKRGYQLTVSYITEGNCIKIKRVEGIRSLLEDGCRKR